MNQEITKPKFILERPDTGESLELKPNEIALILIALENQATRFRGMSRWCDYIALAGKIRQTFWKLQ